MKCTWTDYLQPEDGEPEAVPCNREATAVYSKTNPQGKRPDAPATLVYPRCGRHDTNAAQALAVEQGYTREPAIE